MGEFCRRVLRETFEADFGEVLLRENFAEDLLESFVRDFCLIVLREVFTRDFCWNFGGIVWWRLAGDILVTCRRFLVESFGGRISGGGFREVLGEDVC